jgi:hypothetical protein
MNWSLGRAANFAWRRVERGANRIPQLYELDPNKSSVINGGMNVAAPIVEARTMSPLLILSNHWKQFAAVILMMLVVGTGITKAPVAEANAHAALSGAEHLLHDADADSREVRPIPLLG